MQSSRGLRIWTAFGARRRDHCRPRQSRTQENRPITASNIFCTVESGQLGGLESDIPRFQRRRAVLTDESTRSIPKTAPDSLTMRAASTETSATPQPGSSTFMPEPVAPRQNGDQLVVVVISAVCTCLRNVGLSSVRSTGQCNTADGLSAGVSKPKVFRDVD